MTKLFNAEQLQDAFMQAETETSDYFEGQTCSMKTKSGEHTCPICYFRRRTKYHLGILDQEESK